MTKLADHDLSRESLQLQDFADNVRRILNNGNYEVQYTTSGEPDFDAPAETIIVLSFFGAQYRVYFSYNSAWYYATLTAL